MRELRTIAFSFGIHSTGNGLQRSASGHQNNTAHLEFVGTGEALYGAVAIIITRCFPAVLVAQVTVGTGPGLGHTEWHCARGEMEVTTMGRTYTRFYISGI